MRVSFFVLLCVLSLLSISVTASSNNCQELAVCFAIDESGSIGSTNFRNVISFARTTISKLADEGTQAGIHHSYAAWTFATTSSEDKDRVSALTENASYVRTRLWEATYDGGKTNIYAGVLRCGAELVKSNKRRILILISDGKQNVDKDGDLNALLSMTNVLKTSNNVTIITLSTFSSKIPVSERASLKEYLQKLSSGPKFSFASQFNLLDQLVPSMMVSSCNVPVTPTPTPTPIAQCKVASVCFAIEDTLSMGSMNYVAGLGLIRRITESLSANARGSSFAVVSYNGDASVSLPLSANFTAFMNGLNLMGPSLESNDRNIYQALQKCSTETQRDPSKGQIIVLITSREASRYDSEGATLSRVLMSQKGFQLISVNLPSSLGSVNTLSDYFSRGYASPGCGFQAKTTKLLLNQMNNILKVACKVIPATITPVPSSTPGPYDTIVPKGNGTKCEKIAVCFAIDESSSVGLANFRSAIGFVKDVVELVVTQSSVDFPPYFASWLFDEDSRGTDELSAMSPDYRGLLYSLDSAVYNGGKTNIMEGVLNCKMELAKVPDRTRAMVLLSDGQQNVNTNGTFADLVSLAEDMRMNDIAFFTIGMIGPNRPASLRAQLTAYLLQLASGPEFAVVSDYSSLVNKVAALSDNICEIQTVTPLLPKCDCSMRPPSGFCAQFLPNTPSTKRCGVRQCQGGWLCDAMGKYQCTIREVQGWVLEGLGDGATAPCHNTTLQQVEPIVTK